MDLGNMSYVEKSELAFNPITPLDILRELAKDKDRWVREYVAAHSNASDDTLRQLVGDKAGDVRGEVAENPKASGKIVVMVFEYEKSLSEPDDDVIRALYAHKNLPAFVKRVIETLFGEMLP